MPVPVPPAGFARRRALLRVGPVAVALALASTVASATPGPAEAARIDALIDWVSRQQSVRFVRNGVEHGPADAAAHLRTKLARGGARIRTAEQFVEHLASRSSMTGRPYRIRWPDGRETDAGDWLREALR